MILLVVYAVVAIIVGSGVGSGGSVDGVFRYCVLRVASIDQRKQQYQRRKYNKARWIYFAEHISAPSRKKRKKKEREKEKEQVQFIVENNILKAEPRVGHDLMLFFFF